MSGSKTVRASCYVGVSGVVDDISFAVISFGAAPRAVPLLRAGTIIFKEECIPISRPETARASCNEYIPARVDRDAISNIMTRATPRGIPLQRAGAVILEDEHVFKPHAETVRASHHVGISATVDRDFLRCSIIISVPQFLPCFIARAVILDDKRLRRPGCIGTSHHVGIPGLVDRDAIRILGTRTPPRTVPQLHAGAVIFDDECLPTNYRRRIRFAYQKNASVRADRDIGSPVIIRTTPSNV